MGLGFLPPQPKLTPAAVKEPKMLQPDDVEYLSLRFPGYTVVNEGNMICVLIPNFFVATWFHSGAIQFAPKTIFWVPRHSTRYVVV